MSIHLDFNQGVLSYVSLAGLGSLGLGGLFALLAKASSSQAHELDSVRQLDSLADLKKLASVVPLLVAVTGRVCSKLPLQCEMTSDKAVIREVVEEEYVWKAKLTGAPQRESVTLRSEHSETEWYLADNSRVSLRVEGGSKARGLVGAMDVRQEYYHDKGEGAKWKAIANLVLNMKKDGTAKTERFLPLGAVVTAVGQLAKVPTSLAEEAGELILRRPPGSGSPFYITKLSLKELQRELSSSAARLRYCAWAMGVLGACLLVNKAVRRLLAAWRVRRMRRKMREEMDRIAAARAAGAEGTEEGGERQPDLCVVCLETKVECVYVPCGHMCCCFDCGRRVSPCPICRTSTEAIRVFQP